MRLIQLILSLSSFYCVMSHQCEQVDSTDRFIVEGTSGASEYRTCDWAVRFQKKARCSIEVVRANCPVACHVPCPSSSPSLEPSTSGSPSIAPSISPTSLPSVSPTWCDDKIGSFLIEEGGRMVKHTCAWARRLATNMRCNNDIVRRHCPVTCGECPGSASPSVSTVPSASPTELVMCDDLEDNPDRFHVPYTWGKGSRTCAWAGRLSTNARCKIEIVQENCPVTCKIKCNNGEGVAPPPIIPVKSERAPEDNVDETLLAIVIPCVLLILIAILIGFVARRKGQREMSEERERGGTLVDVNGRDLKVPPFIHADSSQDSLSALEDEPSPRFVDVKEIITNSRDFAFESVHISHPSQESDLLGAGNSAHSFISGAKQDIGKIMPLRQDVHSCENVKCNLCASHKKIQVVHVPKNPTMVSQMGASGSSCTSDGAFFGPSGSEGDDDTDMSDFVY